MTLTTKTYRSTGSDGYTAGTYGYTISDARGTWTDGGYESRQLARAAARKHEARIRRAHANAVSPIYADGQTRYDYLRG